MNYAEKDKELILEYLSSNGNCVEVAEIFDLEGLEKLRVYPLLYRLKEEDKLEIIAHDELGAPIKVRLKQ